METAMTDATALDLRRESPHRRHALVFETFTELTPGSSYVLVSDQDPKPLHYQFAAEYAGLYTWQYLEEGPELWQVRIGRRGAAGPSPTA